jgi:hypothetical protein
MEALLGQADGLAPWVGGFDRDILLEWLRLELGNASALDEWVTHGGMKSKAVALSPVLHVVSGNTPHAAFQSVLRGLLAGCRNRVKLPSAGLPEFEKWVEGLPEILKELLEIRHELPEEWLDCEAAVIFGGAETMLTFQRKLPASVRRIEHGPKLSIGVIFEPAEKATEKIAEDVLRHDQRGCLSVQAIYVAGDEAAIFKFGDQLAAALAAYRARHGRLDYTLSDSGAVANSRELARYRAANGDGVKLWESTGSTEWTVLFDREPKLLAGPLNGFVRLHPLPENFAELGPEAAFVSTVAIFPFSDLHADRLAGLAPPRICEAGKAQEPTIFWHHDGMPPLASLVRWRDLG